MMRRLRLTLLVLVGVLGAVPARTRADDTVVNLAAYKPESGVVVRQDGQRLRVAWPMADGEHGVLPLQLRADRPLIEGIGIAKIADGPAVALLRQVNPVTFLTVGTRDLSKQGWNAFFDNPPLRPHETFP